MPEGQFTSLTRNPEVLPDELLEEFEPRGTDPLGEGAFAVVRLLRRRKTGELFALKCVEKYPLQIRNMLAQMHREVRIHKALSHPNILQLVRVFDDPAYVFMLLEYCEKGPLRQVVAEAPKSRLVEPEAVFYFDQIVKGVEWMHRNSCVHRDLKLENMLLTAKDEIKICDFGWSAEVETDRLLKTVCGTTAYWPPELWESEPQDEAVDLWALGCLLYEMLASHPPFFAREQQDLGTQVLKVHFACPPWFSNEACHCVHCLLQREPHQRIRSKDLRRHPWLKKHASTAGPVRIRHSARAAAPNEAHAPAPPAPPPPPPRALAPRFGRDAAPELARAALPGPTLQAALPQALQAPGKPLLLPAPKLASEAGAPGGAPGFSAPGAGPHMAPEAVTQSLRPALRQGQPLPADRRPGTVERRLAWDVPPNPRVPLLPGPAVAGGGPALGPSSPGWEETLAAVRAAGEAGAASAAREAGPAVATPSARESGSAAVAPRSADFPRSPVSRATSMGGAAHQSALSPTRKRTTVPPVVSRPSEPYGPSSTRFPGSADAIKEIPATSSAHGRWPNGSVARAAPADATARHPAPAAAQQPSSGRFGGGSSVKAVVANSVSPSRNQVGAAGYAPAVVPNNSPTSLRLPLPSAQSFPAHHIFASEAGCGTPLNSALLPGGKAQSFSVQSPSTSFFLQSMALSTSPAPRSPAPHHSPTPHSPQNGQCGTPLAHSGSGSIVAAATRSGGGGFFPQSGSMVVRHSPPPMQCNYYAGGLKPKVLLPFGGANDSFSLDTSVLSQAIAT